MTRDKRLNIRISDTELELVREEADALGVSMADVIRTFIRTLAKPKRAARHSPPHYSRQA